MSKEIRLLSTSAILGYGFPEASLQAGLERRPHVIGVDGGSVDPGPHYLGVGTPYDAAFAFNATLPRLVPAGDFGDTDVYGCQQHAPLLDVDLPT